MRPEKASRLVNNAIQGFLKHGSPERLYNNLAALKRLDKKLRADDRRINLKYGIDTVYDDRCPYELIGYSSEESIRNNMMYISDRFMAPHRMNWLIAGVENREFGPANNTEYLLSNEANKARLEQALADLKSGNTISRELIEV